MARFCCMCPLLVSGTGRPGLSRFRGTFRSVAENVTHLWTSMRRMQYDARGLFSPTPCLVPSSKTDPFHCAVKKRDGFERAFFTKAVYNTKIGADSLSELSGRHGTRPSPVCCPAEGAQGLSLPAVVAERRRTQAPSDAPPRCSLALDVFSRVQPGGTDGGIFFPPAARSRT
jgi:hypothetical protein